MRNIWTVLQIQQTHDTKTIRHAYAKQLKEANPEIDPEGFKKLRAAYEEALNHAAKVSRPNTASPASTAIQHSSQVIPNPPKSTEVIDKEAPQPQIISGIPKARKVVEKNTPQPQIISGIPKASKIDDSLPTFVEETTQVYQLMQKLFTSENESATVNLLLRWNHEGVFHHFGVSEQFQEELIDYLSLQNHCLKKLFLTSYELFSWDQLLLKTNTPLAKTLISIIEKNDLRHLLVLFKKLQGFPLLLAAALNDFESASDILKTYQNIIHDVDANGNNALHIACTAHATEFVSFLIAHQIDVNAKNLSGKTALIIAIEQKNLNLVRKLCEAGADINICDHHHNTPLQYAVSSRYVEMMIYLALLPQIKLDLDALYFAVRTNQLNMVKAMIDLGCDVTPNSLRFKESPLVCAARNDFLQILGTLLNAGADPNQRDRNDDLPLIIAAERGFTQAVTLLLQKGAEQNHIILAAHQALKSNYFHIVQLLAGTNDLSTVDKIRTFAGIYGQAHAYGFTSCMDDFLLRPEMVYPYAPLAIDTLSPLFQALYRNDTNLFKELLSQGADPHQTLANGLALLHVAIQLHRHEQFDTLLQHHVDINQRAAPYYFSPLFIAVKVRNQYAYRKLIELDAEDLPTSCYHTALFAAVYNNDLPIMQELIARGSDIYQYAADGYRTLIFAAARMKHIEALQLLISLGLDPDMIAGDPTNRCCFPRSSDEIPDTPLTAAVKNRDLIGMQLLLEAGADPNRKSNGTPPLHLTLANGYYPASETVNYYAVIDESHAIIDLLLKFGANINLKSDEGHTFLIKAIQSGPVETAIHLIESGADVFLSDSDGKLPIDHAKERNSSLLMSILEQEKVKLHY
jgi:ankyrin repeat protein